MFVDIQNFKSAIAVENILIPYKKGRLSDDKKQRLPKEKITPEVCFEVLQSTNYARNIKDMLLCIAELPVTEQAQFKEVILSTFSQREQPDSIMEMGENFARLGGYSAEFKTIIQPGEGEFLLSSPKLSRGFRGEEIRDLDLSLYDKLICLDISKIYLQNKEKLPQVMEFPLADEVDFSGSDFAGVKRVVFRKKAKVKLKDVRHLPFHLDVSMCDQILVNDVELTKPDSCLKSWKYNPETMAMHTKGENLSGVWDFSAFGEVRIEECNLEQTENFLFRDGAAVSFGRVFNIPQNLDYSKCQRLEFSLSDLDGVSDVRLKDEGEVHFISSRNLPPNLDVSRSRVVEISYCDLSNQQNLHFMPGAEVNFQWTKNLSPQVDFSECRKVVLDSCDLATVKSFRFRKGAEVSMWGAKNINAKIDFTPCETLFLHSAKFGNEARLMFKNRKQLMKSGLDFEDDWKGKFYLGDTLQGQVMNLFKRKQR